MEATHDPLPEPEYALAPKAETGKRILAFLIDSVVAWAAGALVGILMPALGSVVNAGYFLVRDGLTLDFMDRRSLGKHVMDLRPVRLDGTPMDLEASIRRNWMFAVGGLVQATYGLGFLAGLLSFAAGLIALYELYRVVTDPQGRRWGDELAETKVVEDAG